MDKVKVGIIGVGYLGMQHARITSYLEEAELAALADIDFKKALTIGNRHGVKYYQNYEDMLDEIDAGIVATPTSEHFRISMNLLERGKHVLVEKPITETIEQAERLVEKARENGLILQVGHLERFNPAVQALKDYRNFSDRVHTIITHNEPWVTAAAGYFSGEHAPGIKDPKATFQAMHHLLLSHGLAAEAIRASARQPAVLESRHVVAAHELS